MEKILVSIRIKPIEKEEVNPWKQKNNLIFFSDIRKKEKQETAITSPHKFSFGNFFNYI
jgi:hypothetical protein